MNKTTFHSSDTAVIEKRAGDFVWEVVASSLDASARRKNVLGKRVMLLLRREYLLRLLLNTNGIAAYLFR